MPYYVVELHITRYFSVHCVAGAKMEGGGGERGGRKARKGKEEGRVP